MTNPIRRILPGDPIPEGEPRRYVDHHGYILLRWPRGTHYLEILEHRLIMGNPDGDVHHRNGNKLDNRPENLEVLTASEHSRRHVRRKIDLPVAKALYATGHSTVAIAKRFGTHPGNISRALRQAGVTMRDSGSGQRTDVSAHLRHCIHVGLEAGLPVAFVARGARLSREIVERIGREERASRNLG